MIRIPELRWVGRFVWAIAGVAWFVWLGYEDRGLSTVMSLSAVLCLALSLTWVARGRSGKKVGRRRWLLESMGIGLLVGALVPPVAVLLILVKISLHAHGTPDFTSGDVGEVIRRLPVWMLAGVLCGEALGLLGAIFGRLE